MIFIECKIYTWYDGTKSRPLWRRNRRRQTVLTVSCQSHSAHLRFSNTCEDFKFQRSIYRLAGLHLSAVCTIIMMNHNGKNPLLGLAPRCSLLSLGALHCYLLKIFSPEVSCQEFRQRLSIIHLHVGCFMSKEHVSGRL